MVQEVEGRWSLLAVISWGMGCALADLPGISVFIPSYKSWIAETTKGDVYVPEFFEKNRSALIRF